MGFEFASELIATVSIGLIVGFASVYLGLGGGIIIVPLLPLAANVSVREAIGTSLFAVLLVALQNVSTFQKQKRIYWAAALAIGIFSAIGSFVAGWMTAFVSDLVLHCVFAALLLVVAAGTFIFAGQFNESEAPEKRPYKRWASVGFGTGLLSGFTGTGGGILIVPALSLIGGINQGKVVPTSVATVVLTAGAGALAFLKKGIISSSGSSPILGDLRLDLSLAIFLGAFISSRWAMNRPNLISGRKRDWLIGVILLALAVRTFIQIMRNI